MKPSRNSKRLMSITHSKAKMHEYNIPMEHHLSLDDNKPDELFSLTIGMLGDFCNTIINDTDVDLVEKLEELKFVSDFFDTYLKTRLSENLNQYLLLLGSATFYLSNQQGSAGVLIREIILDNLNLDCESLEKMIYWILKSDYANDRYIEASIYQHEINNISSKFKSFFETGILDDIYNHLNSFREKVYNIGSFREILFVDVIYALIKSKIRNSTWVNLPLYTDLDIEIWRQTILKHTFIREFWPSQHLLGEKEIFKGKSAVIQLPTSAGKTKSTELIIRSSFLSERAGVAIIVAPFRALCNEIKNDLRFAFQNENITIDEFTDVLQNDTNIESFFEEEEEDNNVGVKSIYISTPEKLYYLLKQFPELASKIGLLIYDEGHQFDSGSRGVIYELLVTSLKKAIGNNAQIILISAVISNASNINDWLNSEDGAVVSGINIGTNRTIAFTSWTTELGQLRFINKDNIDQDLYFVPRVLSQYELSLFGRERTRRFFPEKNSNGQIATYFAFKLISNGSVAVFVPRQMSINTLCLDINTAYTRGLTLEKPIMQSNNNEITKLHHLYSKHLGENNEQTKAVALGITTHHGNLPDSIKLSVEYALQNNLAKIVFCTSTLAQGVNLPIRYLIVTGVQQGKEQMKIRDFHNLIGRSGRAGKYTEGSIIFADKDIYDKKDIYRESWRWDNIKTLLDVNNSEEIESNILDIFSEIHVGDEQIVYFNNVEILMSLLSSDIQEIYSAYANHDVGYEFSKKRNFLLSIENFIIENFDSIDTGVEELAELTLAYHLADETKRILLRQLFVAIKSNIEAILPEDRKRKVYSKTLFGIHENQIINQWLDENIDDLVDIDNETEYIESKLWNFIKTRIRNKNFINFNQPEYLDYIYFNWVDNLSYADIYNGLADLDIRIGSTSKVRHLTIEHIAEICEKALSFEATLILSSIIAFLDLYEDLPNVSMLEKQLSLFQKKLKYGLNSEKAIVVYEMGFVDKFISMELANLIGNRNLSTTSAKQILKSIGTDVENVLRNYPSYFTKVYNSL